MNRPTFVGHIWSIAGFDDPVFDLALVIFVVEFYEAMRVGRKPIRNGSLHRDCSRGVKGGRAVMCESGNARNEQAGQHESENGKLISHAASNFLRQAAGICEWLP